MITVSKDFGSLNMLFIVFADFVSVLFSFCIFLLCPLIRIAFLFYPIPWEPQGPK